MTPLPFARLLERNGNSFGLVRLLLACVVILSHARTTGGFGSEQLAQGAQVTAGRIAVYGFFAISGFLVSHSFAATGSLLRYAWNRALRILPGFFACLLATAFVLAPIERLLEGKDLVGTATDAWNFLRANWLLRIHEFHIGDLTLDRPHERNFIGPHWTLIYEAKCYVAAAGLGALGAARRPPAMLTAWLCSLAIYVVEQAKPGALQPWSPIWIDPHLVELLPHFLFGCLAWSWRDAMKPSAISATFLIAASIAIALAMPSWLDLACTVSVGYLALCASAWVPLRTFGTKHDLSYGMYLYGFQIEQMLTTIGAPQLGYTAYAMASLVCTVPLAAASWFAVERRAMRWKARSPVAAQRASGPTDAPNVA